MRVLVCAVGRSSTPTGVDRFASNLCRAIQFFGEPILAVGKWQRRYYEEDLGLLDSGVTVKTVDIENSSIGRNRWYLSGLGSLSEEVSADVLHAAFPMPIRQNKPELRVAGTLHDLYAFDSPENFGFPNYLLNQLAFKNFVKSVGGLTCVSRTTLTRFDQLFPGASQRLRPDVIYNSLGLAANPSKPDWIEKSSQFFLCVAQHRKNNNLSNVVAAFESACSNLPEGSRLVIVGEAGPETKSLQAQTAKLGLGDLVAFRASLPEDELQWLYANAVALISPSLQEGFCLPVLEAAQQGSPTIVSDIPIFREIAPSSSHFVNPLNVDSIRSAIVAVMDTPRPDPLLLSEFQISASATKYKNFYEGLFAT